MSERTTAQHVMTTAFAWGVWFLGFYSLTVFSFLLAPVQREFQPTELELAWLTGIAIGASGVGGLLFGWLADRLGRKGSIWLAAATFALGNALCALAPNQLTLAAARALTGLGVGGSWGAGQALLGETVPAHLRGRFGALAQSGAPLGLGLATLVGTFVTPALGWRWTLGLSALPVLLLALLARVPESEVWRRHQRPRSVAAELLSRNNRRTFGSCLLLTVLNMSNYWFAITWLPRYLQQERGLSVARSGIATLIFVAGSLCGYLAFGWLSDLWGRRKSFTLFCLVMAGGLLMFTVFWPLIAQTPGLVLAFLFIAGLGTGTWSSYGPMFTELFPTSIRGSALSIIMNLARGVQFVAPVVIASVAPRWGMAGGIALAAGFAVAAALWIWTLPETRGRVISTP